MTYEQEYDNCLTSQNSSVKKISKYIGDLNLNPSAKQEEEKDQFQH